MTNSRDLRRGDSAQSSSLSASSSSPFNQGIGNLYPGILPALPPDLPDRPPAPGTNAATGASAASVRALTSQAIAFYFRAPVKAFFRTRVDYLVYARALHEQQQAAAAAAARNFSSLAPAASAVQASASASSSSTTPLFTTRLSQWLLTRLRATTPAVLASAVRHSGWRVVPDQVLPPLIANVAVGAVLYTSYLQILGLLHPDCARNPRRPYPPPHPLETFTAGLLAGAAQSVVAAPLDAVQARWEAPVAAAGMTGSGGSVKPGKLAAAASAEAVMSERPASMWAFSAQKLKEIGVRGCFAGWSLSLVKDGLGSAVFFSVFEVVKAQGYYGFVRWFYGSLNDDDIVVLAKKRPPKKLRVAGREFEEGDGRGGLEMPRIIRPHYAIEPAFLLLAGMSASVAQQVVLHPLSHVQAEHWERLEGLDAEARRLRRMLGEDATSSAKDTKSSWRSTLFHRPANQAMFKAYRDAYRTTWAECRADAQAAGLTMRQWLYRGFWWNTIRQVPSTSAGLIIFELFRRKYGVGEEVRINRDGYDIVLY